MGTFLGHLVPGIFFTIFGFYHVIRVLQCYFSSLYFPQQHPFRSQVCWSSPGRVPIEAYVKVIVVVVGIIGEVFTAFDADWNFVKIGNGQHITMFAFFGLHGVVDLLNAYQGQIVPIGLDYLSGVLAFGIEGVLFAWHLHGRPAIDVQVHTHLVYLIIMCAVGGIWEMNCRHDVKAALTRSTFMVLQGLWFVVVGQILYPISGNQWNSESHEQMMIVSMIFCWTVGLAVVLELLMAMLMLKIAKRRYGQIPAHVSSSTQQGVPMQNTNGGYHQLNLNDPVLKMFSDDDDEL
ncbi:hypothetical protein TCAL_06238 [Tigriopus californicus]|uniref:Transmembrane protein 45B n=1 Tax=Tigriopus californicus TaxID=6832 RepID=A0A553N9G6_TIGCA|nr:transmembrane protein 45B-like [Tigriopus californicus]TRY62080.1 hypothetical protein TCAL_06238 [Tigriopus californicus]|eukprot:TCALIF_06238-PA protein Name:"Similar to tmem45b Transmembrane protein 45B (Xenopus laevis)" AED:0.05 eAED:0.05 QI:72/1/1/1/1/1/3/5/290